MDIHGIHHFWDHFNKSRIIKMSCSKKNVDNEERTKKVGGGGGG